MKTAAPTLLHPFRLVREELSDLGSRHRKMRALLDDIAEIPWWHPAWWSIVGLAAIFECYGPEVAAEEVHAIYLSADGSPRIDAFMGRKARNPSLDSRRRIARAVIWARSAVDTLDALDGTLPRQPLHRCVARDRGWLRRRTIADSRRVAFLTPNGAYLARITPGCEPGLAHALAQVIGPGQPSPTPPAWTPPALTPIDVTSSQPTPAAVAVSLLDVPLDLARHIHRQVWTRGGGPWLGVGTAPPYEITTTCHLVTDGYGHWLVTDGFLRRVDALADLENRIVAQLEPGPALRHGSHEWRDVFPTGIADTMVEGRVRFAEAAYTFGRTMARLYQNDAERARAPYSPTFQVPIAPDGPEIDPGIRGGPGGQPDHDRRQRRVVLGLMALRRQNGELESFEAFRDRLPVLLEREKRRAGVLTRLALAAARIPVPDRLRQHYLGAPVRPKRWSSLSEVLAGRGVLSCMRLGKDELPTEPFYAAPGPPLQIAPHDPRGATVLTLMHYDDFATVTTSGTGLAATHDGAEHILQVWLEELERLRRQQSGNR